MAVVLDYKPSEPNLYADLVSGQDIALIPSFVLESGCILKSCQVAYKTWGALNANRDNVLVICHALSGSSDVADWWAPLLGPGKALDYTRFFIFCGNVLGSPYGSASPLTLNVDTGRPYGPEFPQTSIRDDILAHKLVLDALGVQSVAAVIGGSMGGMATLEWPLCTPSGYVNMVIPISTAASQSAWGISWSEVQRQCICSDPMFRGGCYEPKPSGQPAAGLATARMIAMLTYRSEASFDKRFGRKPSIQDKHLPHGQASAYNRSSNQSSVTSLITSQSVSPTRWFSAQDYLHYQGLKFLRRFDANCYLHLINKMDLHDVTRGRVPEEIQSKFSDEVAAVLSRVPTRALVISIESDVLFLPGQQHHLVSCLKDATLVVLKSTDGHDGFLLEFEQLNNIITGRLRVQFSSIYEWPTERAAKVDEAPLRNGVSVGEMD